MTVNSPRHRASRSSGLVVISRPRYRAAPIAVGAHADMAGWIKRLVTQRARRTARRDNAVGPGGELSRRLRRQEYPNGVGAFLGVIEHHRRVELGVGDGEQLDYDSLRLGIPTQTHCADTDCGVDGRDQRTKILAF